MRARSNGFGPPRPLGMGTPRGFGRDPRNGPVTRTAPDGSRILAYWEREAAMVEALPGVLADIDRPVSTIAMAHELALRLNTSNQNECARFLTGVAPLVPQAKRDTSASYTASNGAITVPWVWTPYAQPEQKEPAAVSAAPSPPETPPLRSAAPEPGTPAYRAMRLAEVEALQAQFPLGEAEEEW